MVEVQEKIDMFAAIDVAVATSKLPMPLRIQQSFLRRNFGSKRTNTEDREVSGTWENEIRSKR